MTELLSISKLSKTFTSKPDLAEKIANLTGTKYTELQIRAVDQVSLKILSGEVLGLVGESGCGKSTLGRMLAGVETPTGGTISYRGTAVREMSEKQHREWSLEVQMIFQDPFASLNPRMRVDKIIGEAPVAHGLITRKERREYVADLMAKVGLSTDMMDRFPHQFSGGQRQRIGIARALALRPKLIVCDEAISALDVSIQAQVLNLFQDLRKDFGFAYLFISHDLGAIAHIADRVAVMYLGQLVEIGASDDVFDQPSHPYTKVLLQEATRLDRRAQDFTPISGEIPSPLNPPSGCYFHPRCPVAAELCRSKRPGLIAESSGHKSTCLRETGEVV